ncbi:C1_2 domain-containing protein [Psidium guajava]|nr:C1_2 domain-containing protein [Psidium guajava]
MGFRHFSHKMHDLVICSKADYEQVPCAACGDMCSGMTYACKPCRLYIHHSCLLPEDISHPAHPPHRLFLDIRPVPADFTCSACCRSLHNGFCFLCREPSCSFAIDVKCACPPPAVFHPNHRHRLHLFDELPEDVEFPRCDACREPCKSSVLYCLECKFGVHLLCERPSCLFEHEHGVLRLPWSRCPTKNCLELRASIDEEDVPRDLLSHCLYCQKEIGPLTPLYYCKDCKMIAHVKCVFSKAKSRGEDLEMIRAQAKQDGEQQGNLVAKEAAMQHIETFGVMVDSLNDVEKAELEDMQKRRAVETIKVLAWRNCAAGSSDGIPNSPFLDEAFSEFRKKLPQDIPRTNSLAVASEDERLFKVAEYKITQKLSPDLRKLFVIHGDVSEESRLTQNPKIMVFIMLCGTIYSMANTRVAEVTEELLYNWWKYLMFIHVSGFKIQFAIDRLKIVMRAHYTDLRDDNNCILRMDKEIRELSDEIEESKSKLGRLKDKRELMLGATDENLVEACLKGARAWEY